MHACNLISNVFIAYVCRYSNSQHKDVVRGLSWSPTDNIVLKSCGLDSQLLDHALCQEGCGPVPMEAEATVPKSS